MGKKIVENETSESEDISLLDRNRLERSRKYVNALSSGSSGWGMLSRTRALDYVTLQGLTTLTGCEGNHLDILCLKELIDNGLDASSVGNSSVDISLVTLGDFINLSVKDNGSGLTESQLRKISDFNKLYSSKYYDKTPTRGALGNAFKVLLGAPYAIASEKGISFSKPPIKIRSKDYEYDIELQVDDLKAAVKSIIHCNKIETDSTEISVNLPIPSVQWGWKWRYLPLLQGYAFFNPETDLTLTVKRDDLKPFTVHYSRVGERKRQFKGRPSIHWFKKTEFSQLIYAKIRAENQGDPPESIRDCIEKFRGLSRYNKINEVIEKAGITEEMQTLSDLSSREGLVDRFFDAIKRVSPHSNPNVVGEIGEKAIRDRLIQIFGEPDRFKYGITRETNNEKTVQTPYIIEVAIGAFPKNSRLNRNIFIGVNHSPFFLYNPFDRCLLKWNQKDEEHVERGVIGLLEKYGIKRTEPVVAVIHIISPRVEYTSYGKGEMNTEPFEKSLAQVLYKTCNFYYHHKRAQGERKAGQKSKARRLLVEELLRRKEILGKAGSIPENERSPLQGLFYKIRKRMGGETDITRKSFIAAISNECRSLDIMREELGIFAAVRAEIYFRGDVYPVSWDKLKELAELGSDVILIEKEGVSIALEPFARRRGVALINSRGFIVEYAKELMDLLRVHNANLFQLTDMDASGLLISTKVEEIPRIGIDHETIVRLGLVFGDVSEMYKPHKKHLKALPKDLQDSVRHYRIEIDSVLAEVGPDKFWEHLEERMVELAPKRDLTRSLDLSINLPDEISGPIDMLTKYIKAMGKPKQEQIMRELREWENGFIDVAEYEQRLQKEIVKSFSNDARIKKLSKALTELVSTLYEK